MNAHNYTSGLLKVKSKFQNVLSDLMSNKRMRTNDSIVVVAFLNSYINDINTNNNKNDNKLDKKIQIYPMYKLETSFIIKVTLNLIYLSGDAKITQSPFTQYFRRGTYKDNSSRKTDIQLEEIYLLV